MNREKLYNLLHHLRKKTGRDFKDLLDMLREQGELDMPYKAFVRHFLREDRFSSVTQFNAQEIASIIKGFVYGLPPGQRCHVFEALLVCEWSGVGLSGLTHVQALYSEASIQASIQDYLTRPLAFDFFAPETQQHLQERYDPLQATNTLAPQPLAAEIRPGKRIEQLPGPFAPSNIQQPPRVEISVADSSQHVPAALAKVRRLIWAGSYLEAEDRIYHIREDAKRSSHNDAQLLQYLGILRTNQGRYTEADEYLQIALSKADTRQMPMIQANLGVNAQRSGHFQQATQYFQQSMANTNDAEVSIFATSALAVIASKTQRRNEAHHLYMQAAEQAKQSGLIERQAYTRMNLGVLYYELQDYQQAAQHFELAHGLFKSESMNAMLWVQLITNTALLHARTGNLELSRAQLYDARLQATQMGLHKLALGISLDLGHTYLLAGHPKLAYERFNGVFAAVLEAKRAQTQLEEADREAHIALYALMFSLYLAYVRVPSDVEGIARQLKPQLTYAQLAWLARWKQDPGGLNQGRNFIQSCLGPHSEHAFNVFQQAVLWLVRRA